MANVDVTSTILDATDVAPGRVQDGRSLLGLLADPGAEWGRDILIENGNGANGVPAYRGIRTYRFKYIEHRTTGEYELYDLQKDPYELQSVDGHEQYARVQRDLRSRLRELVSCVGVSCLARPHLTLSVRSGGRRVRSCFRRDLRIRVHGSRRSLLAHADVMIGRRPRGAPHQPAGRPRPPRPRHAHRRRAPPADPPPGPLPPTRARRDRGRPQADARPHAAPLRLTLGPACG